MTDLATDRPARRGPWRWVPAIAAGALLALAAGFLVVVLTQSPDERIGEYTVVIPAGTAARVDRGEDVELMPADLSLRKGTTFVVVNQDDRLHDVGPFTVRAGETIRHQFRSTGTYIGNCTLRPSGQVQIRIV